MKTINRLRLALFGLMGLALLFTNSCKKEEKEETKLYIGDYYAGGIIFYIDDTKKHGLVCAPSDQSTGITWHNGSNVTTNALATDYNTGAANTDKIIAAQGPGTYAASICKDLVLNGYSDWYLPSKGECFQMYFKLHLMNEIGDFADELYWSSTEASIGNAYSQYSNDGYPPNGGDYKNMLLHVRAIRAF